ncbi:MAG TPA: bifunctional pyr operon transcriptional regulator/uracil phosphoribosyltransferase PyrR [Methylophilaceae bacterium]|jgi:pyrimidine operon attenuation protein/uracil phosphoribosyltransferase
MQIPNAEALLDALARQIAPLILNNQATHGNSAIVGIHSGGAWIAERLVEIFKQQGQNVAYGMLDSSFYRDDYNKRGLHADTKPSQIPFEVQDSHIILIDDVFYTGRTIRAAMNELFDYGRPASITLAVMINRGGRELPITPQIVAGEVDLQAKQNLQLKRHADGTFYFELEESA